MTFFATERGERTRTRIVQAVRARPGITLNELSGRLGINWNAVRYHVRVPAKRGVLEVDDRGSSHGPYSVGIAPQYRPWLRAFRGKDSGKVLAALLHQGDQGVYQLSQEWGLSRPVVRSHLSKMMAEGIVEKIGQARPQYRAREVPQEVHAILNDGSPDLEGTNHILPAAIIAKQARAM